MTDRLKRFGLADEIARCFKRSPFGSQKGPFWHSKGVLLLYKTSPFTGQNESFWNGGGFGLLKRTIESVVGKGDKK